MGEADENQQPRRTSYLRRARGTKDSPWANRAANAGHDKPDLSTYPSLLIMSPAPAS